MIIHYLYSNAGGRPNNEDYAGTYQDGDTFTFVLCDGLGGHGKGEVASRVATEASLELAARTGEKELSDTDLDDIFVNANRAVLARQEEEMATDGMKTTMVFLRIGAESVLWGHVGDSRLYYFENGKLCRQTLDHSVPQMLVNSGEIKPKHIRNHPDRNRLLRVLGTEWDRPKDTVSEPVMRRPGQAFLLCSDGFWELIDEKHMEKTLKKAKTPEEWVMLMEEIVLKNGRKKEMDNYTAIAVWNI